MPLSKNEKSQFALLLFLGMMLLSHIAFILLPAPSSLPDLLTLLAMAGCAGIFLIIKIYLDYLLWMNLRTTIPKQQPQFKRKNKKKAT